jgi:hypothetical protein
VQPGSPHLGCALDVDNRIMKSTTFIRVGHVASTVKTRNTNNFGGQTSWGGVTTWQTKKVMRE